ncbi:MAG TPA: twin-arginine translocase TatA/TatE family subunit [Solirubrobacteraceae bacterium]|jgi:sec-independent protein translocase protein TatA|nr:twin-arginine translocase TatA/TatE family subunit [Solirubrobacteraceae bacterium]
MGLENPSHIAILVVVLLLVFGAKRLPEIGRSLGSGMREFKDSISGGGDRPEASQQQPALTPAAQQPQAPAQAPPVAGPATPPATPAEPQP